MISHKSLLLIDHNRLANLLAKDRRLIGPLNKHKIILKSFRTFLFTQLYFSNYVQLKESAERKFKLTVKFGKLHVWVFRFVRLNSIPEIMKLSRADRTTLCEWKRGAEESERVAKEILERWAIAVGLENWIYQSNASATVTPVRPVAPDVPCMMTWEFANIKFHENLVRSQTDHLKTLPEFLSSLMHFVG